MPSKRKFYRAVFEVEVLLETPIQELELEAIAHQIREGDWSGKVTRTMYDLVDSRTMVKLLQAQGSDPEFFRLDAEGNDINDI